MELSDFNITEESIKEVLASGDVYFTYRKKDGTEREAYGTRNTGIIKDYNATSIIFNTIFNRRISHTICIILCAIKKSIRISDP